MLMNREYINRIKKNTRVSFPYLVQLEITNECPFNCPQCYKQEAGDKHMDFYKLRKFVTYCYTKGTRFFVLNGGEPMLYYKILELVCFLNTMNLRVNCFTSGYGVTDQILEIWNFDHHRLYLSLNGSTKDINDKTRQGYDITLKAMEKLSLQKKEIWDQLGRLA